jgi:hypothetical protein
MEKKSYSPSAREIENKIKEYISEKEQERKEGKNSPAYKGPEGYDDGCDCYPDDVNEKWSQEYKDSIDCSNPKGFSQKAHCQGKKKKQDTKESMTADAGGSFEMAFNSKPINRPIIKIHNMNEESDLDEAMTADSAGAYDVPFPAKKRKDPLSIGGEKSIKKSRAVVDKKFPKWGGPKGVYVKVKDKCKKFPYCNQGDTGALEFYEVDGLVETVKKVSKKYGIPYSEMEKVVLNEINKIFIR